MFSSFQDKFLTLLKNSILNNVFMSIATEYDEACIFSTFYLFLVDGITKPLLFMSFRFFHTTLFKSWQIHKSSIVKSAYSKTINHQVLFYVMFHNMTDRNMWAASYSEPPSEVHMNARSSLFPCFAAHDIYLLFCRYISTVYLQTVGFKGLFSGGWSGLYIIRRHLWPVKHN